MLAYDADGATIQQHKFAYARSADQDAVTPAQHRVVVIGAGPVGLTLAVDLAQRGQRVLLLEEPPSIDGHELTDKGYINQRAGLQRRAAWVERLYAEPPGDDVIVMRG